MVVWCAVALATATSAFANTVAGGSGHTVVATPDGSVWTWGSNTNGQLGDGTTTSHMTPAAVPALSGVVHVAAGNAHTLVLKSDGTVWAWGYNWYGQLGDQSTTNRTSPVQVYGLTGIAAIAAGEHHSVALTSAGAVWTWGRNSYGQIGDASTTQANQPVLVSTLTNVAGIGAGYQHTLAVKSDGTAWAWGANTYGQLGDASTTQRTSPVQMSGITGASAVAGGNLHSLILKADGTLRAVGYNGSGQLGDLTWTQRTTSVSTGLTSVASIAAGNHASYARKSDGTVWAWGYNGFGQLGDGTTINRNTATQAAGLSGISLLGAGGTHAIGVTSGGIVSTWGDNDSGKLGDGTTAQRSTAVAISDSNYAWKVGTPVFNVAAGTYTVEKTVTVTDATAGAAIHYTLDGTVPTEFDATIASGSSISIDETRTLKARAFKAGMPASEVASASYVLAVASIALSPSGGTYTSARTVSMSTTSPGATIRYTLDGSTPTTASTVYTSALTIGTSTTVKAVGFRYNWTPSGVASATYTMNFGTLAAPALAPGTGTYTSEAIVTMEAMPGATIRYTTNGSTPTTSSTAYAGPISVAITTTIIAKAFHPDYTASATSTATYTIVVATPALSPTSGTYPAGQVIAVSSATPGATLNYTLNGITPTSSNAVVPAGGIVAGNFTLKVIASKTGATTSGVATAVYQITGSVATPRVTAGDAHSLAVRSDGLSFAWGANGNGQLGDGSTTPRSLPVLVNGITGVIALAAGDTHSVAVTSEGSIYAWGANGYGRLGDGTTTQRNLPVVVSGLSGGIAVAAGTAHSLALKSDGTVWAWGDGGNGQIGNGTTTQQLTAVRAGTLTSVTAISARAISSYALRSDGGVWSWGANGNGQLGSGNTTSRSTPGQISSLTATAISAGSSHALALLPDGAVKAWGYNANGQLGDGTVTQRTSPVAVGGLTNVVGIAAGGYHSLALLNDGTVWAWGYNGFGQLGDGTTTNRFSAVAVSGLPAIASISAGAYSSLAVGTDGSVWAWGRNAQSQLGDGTSTNRLSPVPIGDAGMSWKVPAPVLSLATGLYMSEQTVTVTMSDPGATMHYTSNGSTPTEADASVASGGTINVPQSLTLKVRAFKPAAVMSEVTTRIYELKAMAPTFAPGTGYYAAPQSVAISTSTTSATIRYTIDGSEPTPSSASYSSSVGVSDTRTLKARAYRAGWTPSDSTASSYVIYAGTVATPTIAPPAGSFASTPLVTLASATTGATLRYTLDGSVPTQASPRYVFPFVIDRTTTVTARAFVPGLLPSVVASATYALDLAGQVAPPTIAPAGGRFLTKQTVAIGGAPGATLRYTTTGVDPIDTDAVVPTGGTITVDRAQIVKVRAWVAGSLPSAVRRADFVITGTVAAGNQHSLGLASDGTVWAWGRASEGQVGDGSIGLATSPPVAVLTDAVSIDGGEYFTMAARQDGTVWTWGNNTDAQLGDGTTTRRYTPVQALGLTNIIAVAAGATHSLALKNDGTVWAWGRNASGELGDGTTTPRTTAVQVLGLRGITSIAASEHTSLAVQGDGANGGFVWAWGENADGQLGDGSTLQRPIPVRVLGLTDAVQAHSGRGFSVARLADGTVRAWGSNQYATLGTLGGVSSMTPQVVPALPVTHALTAAFFHAIALDNEGRVFGWGDTYDGQLGMSAYGGASGVGAPVLMPGITGVLEAATGLWHTLLVRPDGTVWATGRGTSAGLPASTMQVEQIAGISLAPNGWLLTDTDGDGLPAWREYLAGLDPLTRDTNGNGLSDLVDLRRLSQSTNPDDDGDGVSNAQEIAAGTDPFLADTDGDGASDLLDAYPLDPTRTQAPASNPSDTTPPTIILTYPASARPIGGE